jgi:formylmethanofuran dehydrogenase subunit E
MQQLAVNRGGKLISTFWLGGNAKHEWECAQGHSWASTWYSILRGNSWCPFCAGTQVDEVARLIEMQSLANSKNGKLHSPKWVSSKFKYEWECAQGHHWTATWHSISGANSWCPLCAGNTPRSIDELKEVALARGGRVTTTEYNGVDATYEFECNLNHTFSNTFRHVIDRRQWCPTCTKGRISEELTRTAFEHVFDCKFPKQRPLWLRNSEGNRMELDGYSREIGVAFEYQGEQHFKAVSIFNTDVEKRIRDDATKATLCEQNNVKLFIITYEDSYLDFAKRILEQAVEFGLSLDGLNLDSEVDFDQAFIRSDRLEELRLLLEPKQIRVLSKKWISVNSNYELQCGNCGHLWLARGKAFFNERRVAGCDKCARAAAVERRRGTMKILQEFAGKFDGVVLSTDFTKTTTYYKFRCKYGHEFERSYQSMKDDNSFCLECKGRKVKAYRKYHVRLNHEDAAKILNSFDLEPLEEYVSTVTKWRCQCLKCGESVTVGLDRLENGGLPCVYCAGKRIRPKDAYEFFVENGITPVSIEDFPGSGKGWPSICNTCGREVSPMYASLKSGQGSCNYCRYETRKKAL